MSTRKDIKSKSLIGKELSDFSEPAYPPDSGDHMMVVFHERQTRSMMGQPESRG